MTPTATLLAADADGGVMSNPWVVLLAVSYTHLTLPTNREV